MFYTVNIYKWAISLLLGKSCNRFTFLLPKNVESANVNNLPQENILLSDCNGIRPHNHNHNPATTYFVNEP